MQNHNSDIKYFLSVLNEDRKPNQLNEHDEFSSLKLDESITSFLADYFRDKKIDIKSFLTGRKGEKRAQDLAKQLYQEFKDEIEETNSDKTVQTFMKWIKRNFKDFDISDSDIKEIFDKAKLSKKFERIDYNQVDDRTLVSLVKSALEKYSTSEVDQITNDINKSLEDKNQYASKRQILKLLKNPNIAGKKENKKELDLKEIKVIVLDALKKLNKKPENVEDVEKLTDKINQALKQKDIQQISVEDVQQVLRNMTKNESRSFSFLQMLTEEEVKLSDRDIQKLTRALSFWIKDYMKGTPEGQKVAKEIQNDLKDKKKTQDSDKKKSDDEPKEYSLSEKINKINKQLGIDLDIFEGMLYLYRLEFISKEKQGYKFSVPDIKIPTDELPSRLRERASSKVEEAIDYLNNLQKQGSSIRDKFVTKFMQTTKKAFDLDSGVDVEKFLVKVKKTMEENES